MHARGYRIADDKRLIGIAPEQVSGDWQASDEHFWIDIQGDCRAAVAHYLGDVRIDPILMQLCDEKSSEIARVIPTEGAIFFALPVDPGADRQPVGYLAALCLCRGSWLRSIPSRSTACKRSRRRSAPHRCSLRRPPLFWSVVPLSICRP